MNTEVDVTSSSEPYLETQEKNSSKGLEATKTGSLTKNNGKQKRSSLACIRCRTRHIKCPGGMPCKKCQLAKTKCEYIEADKKIVVSMKYLSKLHEDIARLKKENAVLRNSVKDGGRLKTSNPQQISPEKTLHSSNDLFYHNAKSSEFNGGANNSHTQQFNFNETAKEVIHPTLDKHGRLIRSRTGEKFYVGSSSMTLFGLEIQDMVPSILNNTILSNGADNSPLDTSVDKLTYMHKQLNDIQHSTNKNENKVLEKEGNAYRITLAKTNTCPGLAANFTLPSYSYAMLLVDTFINYNDGCFYFFNEGLVKQFLMNLYSGNTKSNKKIMKRNYKRNKDSLEHAKDLLDTEEDDTLLETIWFCMIFLIFATGEMYLGTESDTHIKGQKEAHSSAKKQNKKANLNSGSRRNTLPGASYFFEASELFTGLFASGAIDNLTKDGGIEAVLLYAFYLQVADCTIASYFYFGLALRGALILGWHVDAEKDGLNKFEVEHRRRIWWTVYMYERMLSSKAGLPLSFTDDNVCTELPADIDPQTDEMIETEFDVRNLYIFPPHEYIKNCVIITQINGMILSSLYSKQPTMNILPVVTDLVNRLVAWKNLLPDFLNTDFSKDEIKVSRLVVNLMTEYFQGVNLAVRPLLFHFATKKLKELQTQATTSKYIDLSKYSKNILILLNSSFQASICTIKCIWALLPENMVALFGWMDREYLFSSATTLILFNASFGVHEATKKQLDQALILFSKMKKLGNYPAALRRAQLLKLISVLDFNGVMSDLLAKHDEDVAGSNVAYTNSELNSTSSRNNQKNSDKELYDNENQNNVLGAKIDDNITNNDILGFPTKEFDPKQPFGSSVVSDDTRMIKKSDLDGIEGVTYIDEEQKLWNEITTDAVWLNFSGSNQISEMEDFSKDLQNRMDNVDSIMNDIEGSQDQGNYSGLISHEFSID